MQNETELVIRNADRSVYKKFKQKAIEDDETIGEAITEAMKDWLTAKQKNTEPDPKNLLKLNGIIKVGRKVKWSEQVDQILYR